MCVYFLWIYICHMSAGANGAPKGAGGGEGQMPWDWSYRQLSSAMRILGIELGSSTRLVSALPWVIAPASFMILKLFLLHFVDDGLVSALWRLPWKILPEIFSLKSWPQQNYLFNLLSYRFNIPFPTDFLSFPYFSWFLNYK